MKGCVSKYFYVYILIITCTNNTLRAEKYDFDTSLLGDDASNVDLSAFNNGLQQPGKYNVDIMINKKIVDNADINFSIKKDQQGEAFLSPCLTIKQLKTWNIKTDNFSNLVNQENNPDQCVDLFKITSIKPELKLGEHKLLLTIPQAAINEVIGNLAPVSLWDDGITALRMNYSYRLSKPIKSLNGNKFSSNFLQLTPGFNTGPWRVRNVMNWSKSGQSPAKWQYQYTYAERGITPWKSRIRLGQLNTESEVFGTTPFTGVQLATDEDVIPEVMRIFTPAITGVVDSHAQIEVRQNGYLIYTTYAEPGPFSINNLKNLGSQGLLEVTIREDNGKIRKYMVPWQSPALALHQGYMKYYLMAGKYRPSARNIQNANIMMGTIMYGFANNITGYAGVQHADHYRSFTAGIGKSLGYLGSVSLDSTSSQATLPYMNKKQGLQWRLRYSNAINETGSTLSVTQTQNSKQDFLDLNTALSYWMKNNLHNALPFNQDTRSTTYLTLSQSAGWLGFINLNASRTRYYHPGSSLSYGFGWSKNIFNAAINFNWSRNISLTPHTKSVMENQFELMISIPLTVGANDKTLQWSMAKNGNSAQTQQIDLSGSAFNNAVAWQISQQYDNGEINKNYLRSFYSSWQTPFTSMSANYSETKHSSRITATANGGLVLHRHGLTLGRILSDTVAIAAAPGAYNTPIIGGSSGKTDFRGYGIVNYLSTYKNNEIGLDVTRLPANVQLVNNRGKRLVPTQGAILQARFNTVSGVKALVFITDPQGHILPFGTTVSLKSNGTINAYMDDDGEVYLSGLPNEGDLIALYGDNQCIAHYVIPEKKADIYQIKAICVEDKDDNIQK